MAKYSSDEHHGREFSKKHAARVANFDFSGEDTERLIEHAIKLEEDYRFSRSLEVWQYLARCKNATGEREMGKILERGVLLPKNPDGAKSFYFSAAKKLDAEAMYRLSRLTREEDEQGSLFWLRCSAYFGYEGSYYDAARSFCEQKDEKYAEFYDTWSAKCGNKASARLVIFRLLEAGGEENLSYAKWYKKSLGVRFLLNKRARAALRGVKPCEPPEPTLENPKRLIRSLQGVAINRGLFAVAIRLTERLCEYGEGEELLRLGKMLVEITEEASRALGVSEREAKEKAISLFEAAAEIGSSEAARYLGEVCEKGEILEKNATRALTYYTRAAELGDREAYFKIGQIYLCGDKSVRSIQAAMRAFDEGAKAGDANCRAMSGELRERREVLYSRANGLHTTNPKEVFSLYLESSEMGYLPSLERLGECYEYGIGTPVNRKQAFICYKECIEKRHFPAALGIGRCYAHGIGVNRDFSLAVKYLELAKRQHSYEADELLHWLYENKKRHMTRGLYSTASRLLHRKKYDGAHKLLSLAAELGCPEAALTLGALFEFGLGTVPRRDEAIRLYALAGKIPRAKKIKQRILSLYKST